MQRSALLAATCYDMMRTHSACFPESLMGFAEPVGAEQNVVLGQLQKLPPVPVSNPSGWRLCTPGLVPGLLVTILDYPGG